MRNHAHHCHNRIQFLRGQHQMTYVYFLFDGVLNRIRIWNGIRNGNNRSTIFLMDYSFDSYRSALDRKLHFQHTLLSNILTNTATYLLRYKYIDRCYALWCLIFWQHSRSTLLYCNPLTINPFDYRLNHCFPTTIMITIYDRSFHQCELTNFMVNRVRTIYYIIKKCAFSNNSVKGFALIILSNLILIGKKDEQLWITLNFILKCLSKMNFRIEKFLELCDIFNYHSPNITLQSFFVLFGAKNWTKFWIPLNNEKIDTAKECSSD